MENKNLNMKLHVKLYLKNAFFLALLILTSSLWGQGGTFPVQVIPQVTPPPPIYLSNYADASTLNSPLRVQIILNDLNIQNREVRLKTYFQGNGLSFQSNDFVTGSTSLFLEGGVPLVLTNVELAPYFRFENITGISPNVYGNAIPEGTYQICFEVYDLATGNRLSSKSCATTVVFQNEPPFLISPRNKTNVAETNPQNIVFQWTPRSINVTNVEYELSLVEIWDTQIDPQAAFLSSPPIFQTTTSATTYVFGPSDPLLLSGKNYAWRIQAKAKQGTEEIGLFKNQGYSEIFSFSHASACDLPLGINHEVKGSTIANIIWDDFSTDVPEYTVRYRKKSSSNSSQGGGSEWFFNKTTSNTTSLWDLKAGTTYEYQLQKKCPITKSEWSITKQFTTHIADNEESVYECGITPDFSLNNTDPLETLTKGDKFTAGDFPINVLEVSGSKGRFTGKGYVTIPYLNSIRVGVQFTNVLINTDKQLAEGTVITLYDPSLKNILDVDDAIETVGNVVEAVGDFTQTVAELLNLDISKDTKEKINQIVDALIEDIAYEDLPDNLKNSVVELANAMKDAKASYDEAVANGDSVAAANAQSDFINAQSNLEAAQEEIEDYKKQIANLLKEALFELYREGRDTEDSVYQEYLDAKNAIDEGTTPELSDVILIDFDLIESEPENEISAVLENLNRIELKFGAYLFAKILNTEETESTEMVALIKNSKNMGIDFYSDINKKLEANESKSDIITYLKTKLNESFKKMLIENINY
jgi:polyhydroxyalkanoate synthesis regulator phasin